MLLLGIKPGFSEEQSVLLTIGPSSLQPQKAPISKQHAEVGFPGACFGMCMRTCVRQPADGLKAGPESSQLTVLLSAVKTP